MDQKKKKTLQVTLLVKLEFLFFYLAIYMKSRIQLTNYRFHIKDSTPDQPEVKVKPGQGAGAEGLLIAMAPAPADKQHRAS